MIIRTKTVAVFALLAATGAGTAFPASAASVDQAFSSAVAKVLASVHNDFIDGLSAAEKRAFVACAQGVMSGAPQARKQYVLAAKSSGEMRKRFDEVAQDNHAKLKQQISADCAN
jgi:hypothetical protein